MAKRNRNRTNVDNRALQVSRLLNLRKTRALNPNEERELQSLQAKLQVRNASAKPLVTVSPSRVRPSMGNELVPVSEGTGKALEGLVWRNLGDTVAGRNWAIQALHPCGAGYIADGLPDTQCASVATPVYRAESMISFNPALFASTPSDGQTTYNIQIVSVPVPEVDYMYRLFSVKDSVWSRWHVRRTPGYGLPDPATGNAPPSDGITLLSVGYSEYRIIGKGHTLELNASAIANQGRIISGQINGIAAQAEVTAATTGLQVATTPVALRPVGTATTELTDFRVPNTPQFLVMNCPNVYQEEATAGAYIVVKFTAPLKGFQFAQCREGDFTTTPGNEAQDATVATSVTHYPSTALTITATDSPTTDPSTSESQFDGSSSWNSLFATAAGFNYSPGAGSFWHPYVSRPDGVMTTVTFFEGLIVGGDATQGATVRVKTRLALECQTFGGPAVGPFIHPSPLYDDVAITQVAKISQCAPDAYPAKYNGLGDVLGSVWNWMKKIGKPVLTGMQVIPGIGSLASAGLAGMDLADQFLGQVPVI